MKKNKLTEVTWSEAETSVAMREADRVNARITSWLFIAATVTAIVGMKLYDPLLLDPDYLRQGALNGGRIVTGAIFELLLVLSACGTAIMLYPFLKRYSERLALAYFCIRMLETILIGMGIVSMLSLLSLSKAYSVDSDAGLYSTIGYILRSFHDWTFIIGPKFLLGVNTFIYSYVFLRTGLVPRWLALLGLIGAVLVFIKSLLELYGHSAAFSTIDLFLVLQVASYEMILAGRLIINGLEPSTASPN